MVFILDGKKCALDIESKLAKKISGLQNAPKLVIVMVGEDDRSKVYVNRKQKFAEKIGAVAELISLSSQISQEEMLNLIKEQSLRADVSGIIIQTPLPPHLNVGVLFDAIDPKKDVDGLGSASIRKLYGKAWHEKAELSGHMPATTRGIISLLKHNNIEIAGKNVAILGRSYVVGLPTSLAFLAHDATVSICHSKTVDLQSTLNNADIVVCAIGKPKSLGPQNLKENHIVIDVGITAEQGKIFGDVDFESVKDLVSAISPVPGGVGPMTVASLFENLLDAHDSLYNGGEVRG